MRTRLTKSGRRDEILSSARQVFFEKGFAATEMEHIRQACGISRGGLYHHFGNKRAVLSALIDAEVAELAQALAQSDQFPLAVLLEAGSTHMGQSPGILSSITEPQDRLEYLTYLTNAHFAQLKAPLASALGPYLVSPTTSDDVAELFLAVNVQINRREILGQWSGQRAAAFAGFSLHALGPFLNDQSLLERVEARLTAADVGL